MPGENATRLNLQLDCILYYTTAEGFVNKKQAENRLVFAFH